MDALNLKAPCAWSELTQQQLTYLLKVMAVTNRINAGRMFRSRDDFATQTSAYVAARCLLHWNGLTVATPYGKNWLLKDRDKKEYLVSAEDLSAATKAMAWISQIPDEPVRLDIIDGHRAADADLDDGFSFNDYLSCETLWQVWQASQNDDILKQMAAILYSTPDIKLKEFELLSIFYWWSALKQMLSHRYPDFLRPADQAPDMQDVTPDSLRHSMDAQIRALTKGDITKEETILAMPVHRALTELDALAREYEELNRKYPTK